MLTLDMDHGSEDILDELDMFNSHKMCIYSTHKHTPELLDMTDSFGKKLDKLNSISGQDNLFLAAKLAGLQKEKEKCESDRFSNVDQFMADQLDKEVYQRRRADLSTTAERLAEEIAELEQKNHLSFHLLHVKVNM